MRPYTYQLAWLKCEPVQFASLPMLATPAIAVLAEPCTVPSMTRATVEPWPLAYVSAFRTSSNNGPR